MPLAVLRRRPFRRSHWQAFQRAARGQASLYLVRVCDGLREVLGAYRRCAPGGGGKGGRGGPRGPTDSSKAPVLAKDHGLCRTIHHLYFARVDLSQPWPSSVLRDIRQSCTPRPANLQFRTLHFHKKLQNINLFFIKELPYQLCNPRPVKLRYLNDAGAN